MTKRKKKKIKIVLKGNFETYGIRDDCSDSSLDIGEETMFTHDNGKTERFMDLIPWDVKYSKVKVTIEQI